MTWLYVPSTSLDCAQASAGLSAALPLPQIMPPGLSVFVRGKPIAQASYARACRTGILTTALSGLTSKPLTLTHGVALWIASLRAIRASRSAPLVEDAATKTRAISGRISSISSAQLSLPLSFVKTSPVTLPWGLSRSAMTYKAWVMQLRLVYLARQKLAPPTCASGSISLPILPPKFVSQSNIVSAKSMMAKGIWPTPVTQDASGQASPGNLRRSYLALRAMVQLWPTPLTISGGNNVPDGSRWVGRTTAYTPKGTKVSVGLHSAVKRWPTPIARDCKSGQASPATHARNARPLSETVGLTTPGKLNPDWVSLLQGFPTWWTRLQAIGVQAGKTTCPG